MFRNNLSGESQSFSARYFCRFCSTFSCRQSGFEMLAISRRVLLVLLAVSALSVIADAMTLRGRVVAVADGDTITVLVSPNSQHKIRLAGIDAPEHGQPFSNRSKQNL